MDVQDEWLEKEAAMHAARGGNRVSFEAGATALGHKLISILEAAMAEQGGSEALHGMVLTVCDLIGEEIDAWPDME